MLIKVKRMINQLIKMEKRLLAIKIRKKIRVITEREIKRHLIRKVVIQKEKTISMKKSQES
jgi:hypothetical protein